MPPFESIQPGQPAALKYFGSDSIERPMKVIPVNAQPKSSHVERTTQETTTASRGKFIL